MARPQIHVHTLNFFFQPLSQKLNIYEGNVIASVGRFGKISVRSFGKRLYITTPLQKIFIITFLPNHFAIKVSPLITFKGFKKSLKILNSDTFLTFANDPLGKALYVWVYNTADILNLYESGFYRSTSQIVSRSFLEFNNGISLINSADPLIILPLQFSSTRNGALALKLTLSSGSWQF